MCRMFVRCVACHHYVIIRRLIEKQQKVDAVLASLPDDDPSLDLQRTQIEESMSTAEKSQLAKVKEITNK